MDIFINSVDYLLENQHLFNLNLIPHKDLDWTLKIKYKAGVLGKIYFADCSLNTSALQNNDAYKLVINLPETQGNYTVDGMNVENCFLIYPGSEISVVYPKYLSTLFIVFQKDYFEKEVAKNNFYEILKFKPLLFHPKMVTKGIVEYSLKAIYDENLSVDKIIAYILEKYFELVANDLTPPGYMSKREIIKQVIPLMKDRIHDDLSMSEVCETLGMSRRVFELSFKKYFGTSPAVYFKNLKLMQVRRLLLGTNLAIVEILKLLSIHHPGHFGQYYKRVFGETMSDTRNRL